MHQNVLKVNIRPSYNSENMVATNIPKNLYSIFEDWNAPFLEVAHLECAKKEFINNTFMSVHDALWSV